MDDTQTLNKNMVASVVNLTSAVNASLLNNNVGEGSSHPLTNTQNESNVEGINPVNLESEPISVSLAQPTFLPNIKEAILAMLVFLFFCLVIYLMEYETINKMIGFYKSIDSDINNSTQEPGAWQTWMADMYNWMIEQVHELVKGFWSQSSGQDKIPKPENWSDHFSNKTCAFAKDFGLDCFWVPESPAPEPDDSWSTYFTQNACGLSKRVGYEYFCMPEPPAPEPTMSEQMFQYVDDVYQSLW
ncbi:uncharacterized protein [Clytia hemisphaerica]|uniref:uncharacterized protein n=1 Tax=Clytia hemisphaerica TaxID=252671 RepID=UPI0034D438F0|eukprot:TCONS_00024338-protein